MPYKRKYKKRMRKRRAGVPVMRMVRNLARRVQGEVKKHPEANLMKPASILTPIVQSLSNIAQGDNYYEREGLAIKYKYLTMKYSITHDNLVQTSSIRVIIVQDLRQVQSTIPSATDVFTNPANIHSALNPQQAGRFKVHFDKIFWTNSLTKTRIEGKFYKPLNAVGRWVDGTQTTYSKNGFFIIALTDQPAGTSSEFKYYVQMGFYDN